MVDIGRAAAAVARRRGARTRRFAAAIAAAGCVACASARTGRGVVTVEPGSTAQNLVFRITTRSYFYGLTVATCGGGRALWAIGTGGSTVGAPSRVVYGETPSGFELREGPVPLSAGCYRVVVSGPASARFVVAGDGTVTAPER